MQQLTVITRGAIPATGGSCGGDSSPWWSVLDDLSTAQVRFGLKPHDLATLRALLTFLKGQTHMVVFASNRVIIERMHGVCERKLQRAIVKLTKAGVLKRRDSANKKRFATRAVAGEPVERYGLDLSPLMDLAPVIQAAAQEVRIEHVRTMRLRCQLQVALTELDTRLAAPDFVADTRRLLRRKPRLEAYEVALSEAMGLLTDHPAPAGTSESAVRDIAMPVQHAIPTPTLLQPECGLESNRLSASDRQIVGHYHNQKKDPNDLKAGEPAQHLDQQLDANMLREALDAFPAAIDYFGDASSSGLGLARHVETVGGWIGIDGTTISRAIARIGVSNVAVTLMGLIDSLHRIRKPAAYFHALTLGTRSEQFNPRQLITARLARATCEPA